MWGHPEIHETISQTTTKVKKEMFVEIYLLEWFQATVVEGREVDSGTGHLSIDVCYRNLSIT